MRTEFIALDTSKVDHRAFEELGSVTSEIKSDLTSTTAGGARPVEIPNAQYLGGLPDSPNASPAGLVLCLDATGIRLEGWAGVIHWPRCAGVTVDGGEVAKRPIAATLAFGVMGAMAAKGTTDRTYLAVRLDDGSSAYFEIDKATPRAMRAAIASLLHTVNVQFLDEVVVERTPTVPVAAEAAFSIPDQIRELGKLRDEGLLAEGEFTQQKLKLLGT